MNLSNPLSAFSRRTPLVSALLTMGAFLYPMPGVTAAAAVTLPATPVGQLGAQLIQHINSDSSAQIRQWAPRVLSASIPEGDKVDFVANLGSAAQDSGGVDCSMCAAMRVSRACFK
ncbi:MAG: hypothetical protein ABI411_04570 [Tahibacter sp.]